MCGIVGYVGNEQAAPILLNGLAKLEYRGYDSAGIAVRDGESPVEVVKAKGRLKALEEKTNNGLAIKGTCGIGHTRWATHGEPSENNAHPHISDDYNVVGVHNGIIENYQELKDKLVKNGYEFYSSTDTEVAIKLIDYYYKKYEHTPVDAINHAMVRIRGSYAFAIMFKEYPDEIYVARKDSPMILGVSDGNCYVGSDVPAILNYTRNVYYIGNMEIGRLADGNITFYNLDGDEIEKELVEIKWDAEAAEKGGYEHFMMKEIHEQPEALRNTIRPRMVNGLPDFSADGVGDELFTNVNRIVITACGTAMHSGLMGKNMIERLCRIPVTVDIASEFRYQNPIIDEHTLLITVSQSGETADTLAALRLAKERGAKTLSVVNVKGSSIARESDYVLYTHAGPEIAVASTKAYSVQVAVMYLIAFRFALVNGKISEKDAAGFMTTMIDTVDKVEDALTYDQQTERIAKRLTSATDIFFLGRGLDYALSCEGSLKLKEISYIHSEAYAAGELKHGTISLITDNVPVIALATQPDVYAKIISNVQEVRSRGAKVILITGADASVDAALCDYHIVLPETDPLFAPFVATVILQYLAYYVSVEKGLNVDQPRNLAKSVTVE